MARILELQSELLGFNFFPWRALKSMPLDYPRGKEIVRPLLREQPPITPSEAAYGKRYWNPCVIKSRKVYVFLFFSQNFAPSKNNFTIIRKTYLSCKWIYDSLCNWHRSIYTYDLQGNQEYGRSPHHENCLVDGSPSNGNQTVIHHSTRMYLRCSCQKGRAKSGRHHGDSVCIHFLPDCVCWED